MNDFIRKLTPWLPLIVVAGYFTYLLASWQRHLAFQQQVKADMDARLDEFLKGGRGEPG